MSNGYFDFKHFRVRHDLCAMKVGTDGVLLGAWANGGMLVLDVGTGSGLIALCMAQRYPSATVTAIDIDEDACHQATINAEASPFCGRITVCHAALQEFSGGDFDAIVCNPPFFKDSLCCPDPKRTLARHDSSLPAGDLFRHAARLLADGGELSVIIPSELRSLYDSEALIAGLALSRAYLIRTTAHKPISRCLAAYRKAPIASVDEQTACLKDEQDRPTPWYKELTAGFYLKNL